MIIGPDPWDRYTFTEEHFEKIKAVNPDVRLVAEKVKREHGVEMGAISASGMLAQVMIESIQTN